ncbi:agmatinase family protein [Fulvivirgaceae bacterium BMA10]|uniref:Agmatinase family protein n=1 Tax=Splendidivirga corallicola TaxID=3051826 RepID=A0ABT8KSP0_9BACT|nr:agmatinase family protein [Fulvivirgaceae bacterium BMA10]
MTKDEVLAEFDPNGVGIDGTLFGFPFSVENAELVLIPVPWEVTVSYGSGASKGPASILEASPQIDFAIDDITESWKLGITMLPISSDWEKENEQWRKHSAPYIKWLENGKPKANSNLIRNTPEAVNVISRKLNEWVKDQALTLLYSDKMVGVIGGDHSTPYGLISALCERYKDFGILQIDAHADLREAYEGFEFSHASIMYNALKNPQVSKLVQVGVRDYCEAELDFIRRSSGRVKTYFYRNIRKNLFKGENWREICEEIIDQLPNHVYVSFDIDGLDPKLCPNTGTPVPGGFEFEEINFLLRTLVKSGKKIIGFDLCEVAPGKNDQWDGNVGARVLYMLSCLMAVSQGKLRMI